VHLSTGARLGPYEILAPLGAGGMGEIGPSDPSGLVGIFELHAAPETGAYAYTYGRILSELFLAEGIK